MPSLKLRKDEVVKLYGPMAISIKEGCVDVYGKITCSGERFIIHKARNYVVLALSDVELDVNMIDESQIQSLDPSDPYIHKRQVIREIVEKNAKRILVVGCVDCGKTSCVTMIFNNMISRGLKPVVIDADIGQSDIGPPGFISMGSSNKTVYWISELETMAMRFIGDIKPQIYTQLIIHEVDRLVKIAESIGYDNIVIDTDGWVRDEQGIQYKYMLIESIKPDVIVVLGNELKGVFSRLERIGIRVVEINEPLYRKMRTREERRLLRSIKYREFLENTPVVKLKLDDILVQGHGLLLGHSISPQSFEKIFEGKVIYVSRLPGVLSVYGIVKSYNDEELKKLGFEKVKTYTIGSEKGLYCSIGLLNGPEYPCVIERFDFESREVVVRSSYRGRVEVLKISRIRLNQEYVEEYLEV